MSDSAPIQSDPKLVAILAGDAPYQKLLELHLKNLAVSKGKPLAAIEVQLFTWTFCAGTAALYNLMKETAFMEPGEDSKAYDKVMNDWETTWAVFRSKFESKLQ